MTWKDLLKFLAVATLILGYILVSGGCDSETTNGFGTIDPEEDAQNFEEANKANNPSSTGDANTDEPVANEGVVNEPITMEENPVRQTDEPVKTKEPAGHECVWQTETVIVASYSERQTSWKCGSCNFSTDTEAGMEAHSLTHGTYTASTVTLPLAELWVVKCDFCDYSSENQENVVRHQQEYSGEPAHAYAYGKTDYVPPADVTYYTCSCGQFESTSAQAAEQHRNAAGTSHPGYELIEDTQYETYVYSCGAEGCSFGETKVEMDTPGYQALQTHLNEVSMEDGVRHYQDAEGQGPYTVTYYACKGCDSEYYGSLEAYDAHLESCPGNGSGTAHTIATTTRQQPGYDVYGWRCSICGKTFASEKDAKDHSEENPGYEPHFGYSYIDLNAGKTETVAGWECNDCFFFSADEAEIQVHANSHRAFQTGTLSKQTEIATGWEYCTVEGCNKRREAEG